MIHFASVPPHLRHRLLDLLLLPVALLVVLLEDLLWRGAKFVLRWVSRQPPAAWLRERLARLPGWAALPLFLLPELAARLGDIWFALLLYRGRATAAVAVYALVRVVSTLVAVFIWQSCSVALLQMRWFARIIAGIETLREWSVAMTVRLRHRLGLAGGVALRIRLLQRALLMRFRP